MQQPIPSCRQMVLTLQDERRTAMAMPSQGVHSITCARECRICAGDAQPRDADGVDCAGADEPPQGGHAAGGKKDRPRACDGCCGAACKARGRPAATGPPHPGLRAAGELPPDTNVSLEQGVRAPHPSTRSAAECLLCLDASFLFAQCRIGNGVDFFCLFGYVLECRRQLEACMQPRMATRHMQS